MDDDGVPEDMVTSEENVMDQNNGSTEEFEEVQSVHCESNFGYLCSQWCTLMDMHIQLGRSTWISLQLLHRPSDLTTTHSQPKTWLVLVGHPPTANGNPQGKTKNTSFVLLHTT